MKKVFFFLFATLLLTSTVFASTVNLPKTGQTKCYDEDGIEISCSGTGQDGEIQAGVAWPERRFTDNGDGTMTDNLTGLIWTKDGNLPNGTKTWQQALDYVASLNSSGYLGYRDWRLPNVNELESLINANEANSATWLSSQGFTNIQGLLYWSSTTTLLYFDYAMVIAMWDGWVRSEFKSQSFDPHYVWPVRGGQCGSLDHSVICLPKTGQTKCYDTYGNEIACAGTGQDGEIQAGVAWPEPRFSVSDGCVTDNLTGLTWTKDANLFNDNVWQQVLAYVTGMNAGTYPNFGYEDWRLPNRKELYSLTGFSRDDFALPAGHPFTNVQYDYPYWCSTTMVFNPEEAWIDTMCWGEMISYVKHGGYYFGCAWPVRSGQVGPMDQWAISGTVTGDVQAGVTVTLTGSGSGSTATDSSGNYSFTGLSNGIYTVTPSLSFYSFSPPSRVVRVSGADVTGVDFVAKLSPCAAEELITNQMASNIDEKQNILKILRYFRDRVLAQSEEGKELIKLYYDKSPEIVRIMTENPVLAGKTLFLLLKNLPLLKAAAANGSELTMSRKIFTQAINLQKEYESHASAELKGALKKVEAFVGRRTKQINSAHVRINLSD
jgi:hypothetical protein